MTLTDFLLARIAEDEAGANERINRDVERLRLDGLPDITRDEIIDNPDSDYFRRPLRECEAKRRIVEMEESYEDAYVTAVRALAAVYADHPDYREEWRL